MKHRGCDLTGEVSSVEERVVERDAGWAESWGIAKTKGYIDVTVKPFSVTHKEGRAPKSCTGDLQTFQLLPGKLWYAENPLKKGDCIRASARFSGDEFAIGTWLTNVSKVACPEQ